MPILGLNMPVLGYAHFKSPAYSPAAAMIAASQVMSTKHLQVHSVSGGSL